MQNSLHFSRYTGNAYGKNTSPLHLPLLQAQHAYLVKLGVAS